MSELWTVREVAAYLKKSPTWVYRQAALSNLPHRKVGAALRFVRSEIEKWVIGEPKDGA